MTEIELSKVPANLPTTDIRFAAAWIKAAAKDAHMTARWFGVIGAQNDIGSDSYTGDKVYVGNSKRAILLTHDDREYWVEYLAG